MGGMPDGPITGSQARSSGHSPPHVPVAGSGPQDPGRVVVVVDPSPHGAMHSWNLLAHSSASLLDTPAQRVRHDARSLDARHSTKQLLAAGPRPREQPIICRMHVRNRTPLHVVACEVRGSAPPITPSAMTSATIRGVMGVPPRPATVASNLVPLAPSRPPEATTQTPWPRRCQSGPPCLLWLQLKRG